jgi:hypothetical protein
VRTLVGRKRSGFLSRSFLGATLATKRTRCAERCDQQHYKNGLGCVSQAFHARLGAQRLVGVRHNWLGRRSRNNVTFFTNSVGDYARAVLNLDGGSASSSAEMAASLPPAMAVAKSVEALLIQLSGSDSRFPLFGLCILEPKG